MVSVAGVLITQVLLIALHTLVGLGSVPSNVGAVCLSAVPVFFLNKRWVWGKTGPARVKHEIVPFWGFTLLGLAISSGLVAVSHSIGDGTLVLMAANITGFGIVWVAKFAFLDAVVFGGSHTALE